MVIGLRKRNPSSTETASKAQAWQLHLAVLLPSNAAAREFWKSLGWVERTDVVLMSHATVGRPDS